MDNKNLVLITIMVVASVGVFFALLFATGGNKTPEDNINSTNNLDMNQDQAQNKVAEDVAELKIETLQEGEGDGADAGDTVSVYYTGTLLDGSEFDSNVGSNPFTLTLGQNTVIQGWEQGLLGAKKGEKRKLTIPSALGYGERGAGADIPANAGLVFEVEVVEIQKAQ